MKSPEMAVWIAIPFCAKTDDPETGAKRPSSSRLIRYFLVLAGWIAGMFWE